MLRASALFQWLFPLSVLLVGVSLQLARPWPVEFVQNLVFDQYNRWQPRLEEGSPVVFVDIDEDSLKQIGQFPWPRQVFADLVTRMADAGAATITFDILFAEKDRTEPNEILPVWDALQNGENAAEWRALRENLADIIVSPDIAFARAIGTAPVVLATMMNDAAKTLPDPKAGIAVRAQDTQWHEADALDRLPTTLFAIENRPVIAEAGYGLGAMNALIDRDGIIRRAALLFRAGPHIYPSLSLESLRVAQRAGSIVLKASDVRGEGQYASGFGLSRMKVGGLIVPIEPDGTIRMYYTGRENVARLGVGEILQPDFDASLLEGKIAIIGTSAAGLKDIRATPLDPATPGAEVHAQVVQQLISGSYLKRPVWLQSLEALATLLTGLIAIFAIHRLAITLTGLIVFGLIAAGGAVSWFAFANHLMLVDPATPGFSVFVVFLISGFQHYLQTARERQQVRHAFRYYLSPDLVNQISADPGKLTLGGETRNMTILFCDIRGFTSISEAFASAPDKLTHIINIFLTRMSRIIQAREGTIDKYIGDNIMAFWNAPTNVNDHAYEACLAAVEMMDALPKVNEELHDDPLLGEWQGEIRVGIGLNTGDTLVGNIGSDQRFNYSVLGDTVNVSARLEGQTKDYAVPVLVGEATKNQAMAAQAAQSAPLAFVELDLIALKGKAVPERIYTIIGGAEIALSDDFAALQEGQDALLRLYRAQDWTAAQSLASALGAAHPVMAGFYDMLKRRMLDYAASPPGADWDGHFIAVTK